MIHLHKSVHTLYEKNSDGEGLCSAVEYNWSNVLTIELTWQTHPSICSPTSLSLPLPPFSSSFSFSPPPPNLAWRTADTKAVWIQKTVMQHSLDSLWTWFSLESAKVGRNGGGRWLTDSVLGWDLDKRWCPSHTSTFTKLSRKFGETDEQCSCFLILATHNIPYWKLKYTPPHTHTLVSSKRLREFPQILRTQISNNFYSVFPHFWNNTRFT